MRSRLIHFLLATALTLAGCTAWQRDVTVRGVAFSRVTVDHGLAIGVIVADTVVAGRPCARGWLHLHPNGVPASFSAAQELTAGALVVPAGTWVSQGDDGVIRICAFSRDVEVQGYGCRGTGGPEGVQTAFYPGGALKQFFPARDTRIDGVLCRAGLLLGSVELHENGRLKSCRLGEDFEHGGYSYVAGTRMEFLPDGRVRGEP